jgi:hypothetical protein
VSVLSPEKKSFVRKIGFGSLLEMAECELDKDLTMWLVDKVGVIQIGQKLVEIEPLVKSILGLPNGPIKVETETDVDKDLLMQFTQGGNAKTVNQAVIDMYNEPDEKKFCTIFMLVILGLYLAPSTNHYINKSYLGAVSKVDQLHQMDWCGFAADKLIEGIKHYQDLEHAQVKGCVHILTVSSPVYCYLFCFLLYDA